MKLFAGAVEAAFAGIDDAVQTIEGWTGVGHAGGRLPKAGFDAAQAAEAPFVVDHAVDEEAFVGIGRAVEFVIFGGEFSEVVGGFGEHDLLFGVNAVLQGVIARLGLSGGSDGAGGFLSVGSAGGALSACGHIRFLNDEVSSRISGWRESAGAKWLAMSKNGLKIKVNHL